jgi:hypothetical protein
MNERTQNGLKALTAGAGGAAGAAGLYATIGVSVHSFWGKISKFKIGILRSCVQSDNNSVCKTKTPL